MASGKTTVGRLAAERLGLPFIDLDDVVAEAAGRSVRDIFAEEGEAGFRRREREALGRVISGEPAVIATGGGTPSNGDSLVRMRAAGLVVALTAPMDELMARAGDGAPRPLLDQPVEEVRALYQRRLSVYRQAHVGVRTEDTPPAAVARQVVALVAAAGAIPDDALADAAVVALSERTYPVVVSAGALDRLGEMAQRALPGRCHGVGVISDDNVAPLYGEAAARSLKAAGFQVASATVPAGEDAKSMAVYERVTREMVDAGLDRSSAIVALGGGVVGDLAGFVASTLFRGVACLQVPTTVLAMIDSAIGGKTGINIPAGKNLVGSFWQPAFVLADPEVIQTLPVRERRAAVGELVKYALLDGEELYAAVDEVAPALGAVGPPPPGLTDVIRRCAAIKSWIVTRDEREQTGERARLNLGHTVGHAIEAAAGYGTLLHGEAVALGLVASCRVSAHLGLCDAALEQRVAATLRRAGLDADITPWLRDDVLARIGVDKKRTGTRIRFVTLGGVGDPGLTELDVVELLRILRQ